MTFKDFKIRMKVRSKRKAEARGVGEIIDRDLARMKLGVRWSNGEVHWHFPSEVKKETTPLSGE